MTLACEENTVTAHKIVLSAASEFFKTSQLFLSYYGRYIRTHILVLRKHKHEHPLIYLTEVKFADLQSILDFIYTGETEVAERDLESLLATATRFKVKGLTDSNSAVDGAEPVKKKLRTELVVEDRRAKVINTSPPMKTTITPVYHEAAIIKSEVDGDNNLRGVRSTEPLDISR